MRRFGFWKRSAAFLSVTLLSIFPAYCASGNNPVLARYEGGKVTQEDFQGYFDHLTTFTGQGDVLSPEANLKDSTAAQEEFLRRIVFNRIAMKQLEKAEGISNATFLIRLEIDSRMAAWKYLMQTRIYPERIRQPKKDFDRRMKAYYEEHLDEYREPDQASFAMIFFNTVNLSPERKEEKIRLAEELRREIGDSTERFLEMARAHSEANESVRGATMGPYRLDKINPELAAAIRQMQPGQIGPIVQNDKGVFILRLVDCRIGAVKSFEDKKSFIFAELGGFYVYDAVDGFKKELLGDAPPEFLLEHLAIEEEQRNTVVARQGKSELTNAEVAHLLPFLVDAVSNDPNEAIQELKPILEKKALYEAAQEKGLLKESRYERYRRAFLEDRWGERFLDLAQKGQMGDETLKKRSRLEIVDRILEPVEVGIKNLPRIPREE